MFGTPSPNAVAAAAAGTQVRTAIWGGGGGHPQRCPCPSLLQPPLPSPSWDSPQGFCWTSSFQGPSPLLLPVCAAFSSPRPGCGCFSSSATAASTAQHTPPAPRGVVSPDQPLTVGHSFAPASPIRTPPPRKASQPHPPLRHTQLPLTSHPTFRPILGGPPPLILVFIQPLGALGLCPTSS